MICFLKLLHVIWDAVIVKSKPAKDEDSSLLSNIVLYLSNVYQSLQWCPKTCEKYATTFPNINLKFIIFCILELGAMVQFDHVIKLE